MLHQFIHLSSVTSAKQYISRTNILEGEFSSSGVFKNYGDDVNNNNNYI